MATTRKAPLRPPAIDFDGVEITKTKLPYLNKTFGIRKDVNHFLLLEVLESPGVIIPLMLNMVATDERQEFQQAFRAASGITEEKIYEVFQAMFKAASDERPTTPSPGSSRTTASKAG